MGARLEKELPAPCTCSISIPFLNETTIDTRDCGKDWGALQCM